MKDLQYLSLQYCLLFAQNEKRVIVTKDRRDAAVYAFTIVTIIFLPLSTVAGIMGMNTNDIRNMEQDQWLFWAVAGPVTAAVVFIGLLWAGELDNIRRYLAELWRGRNSSNDIAGTMMQSSHRPYKVMARRSTFKVEAREISPEALDAYSVPWEWDDVRLWSMPFVLRLIMPVRLTRDT